MESNTWDSSRKTGSMARVSIDGALVKYTMEAGKKVNSMVRVKSYITRKSNLAFGMMDKDRQNGSKKSMKA